MLCFSSPLKMALSIGTTLRSLTSSSLNHKRGSTIIETIQCTKSMYSVTLLLITLSSPNSASPFCRSPCILTCVTSPRHTSSIARCLGSMFPSIGYSLRLSDTWTGGQLRKLQGHTDWVNSVGFSPDGNQVASGSWDKSVRM